LEFIIGSFALFFNILSIELLQIKWIGNDSKNINLILLDLLFLIFRQKIRVNQVRNFVPSYVVNLGRVPRELGVEALELHLVDLHLLFF